MKANKITLDSIKSCQCKYYQHYSGRRIKIKSCNYCRIKKPSTTRLRVFEVNKLNL